MKFKGKTAVVTGAAQGIGLAIVKQLADEGADIVLSDINPDAGRKAAEEVQSETGCGMLFVPADVAKRSDIGELYRQTLDRFGRIDALVNNAGICPINSYDNISDEEWDLVMAVNLRGVFVCSQLVAPIMKKQGSGTILNMASISGRTARNVGAHYAASKTGVISLTKNFAMWLAPEVRVNAVAPGPVESAMTRAMPKETLEWISRQSLLGCIAKPEEVASAAVFLMSDAASHITGQVLDINAGQYMG